jgi:hypothetical protein
VGIEEAATREADVRGWDLHMVEVIYDDAASGEREEYYAACVTYLTGEAFLALN